MNVKGDWFKWCWRSSRLWLVFINQWTIFGGDVGDVDGRVTSHMDCSPVSFRFLCHTSSTLGAFLNCFEFSQSSESALYPLNWVRYSITYLPLLPFFLQSAIIISTSCSSNSSKLAWLKDLVGCVVNIPIYSPFSHLFKSLLLFWYLFTCHYLDIIILETTNTFPTFPTSNTLPKSFVKWKEHWEHVPNILGIFLIWQVMSKALCST